MDLSSKIHPHSEKKICFGQKSYYRVVITIDKEKRKRNYVCSSQMRIYLLDVWLYHHLHLFPGYLTLKAKHTWRPPKLWGFISSILQIINIVNKKTIQVSSLNVWWLPPRAFDLQQQLLGSPTQYGLPTCLILGIISVSFLEKHWLPSVQHLTSNSHKWPLPQPKISIEYELPKCQVGELSQLPSPNTMGTRIAWISLAFSKRTPCKLFALWHHWCIRLLFTFLWPSEKKDWFV